MSLRRHFHFAGIQLSLLAAVLQAMVLVWAVAEMRVPADPGLVTICHAGDNPSPVRDGPSAPRQHACALCAAGGIDAAFLPPKEPSLPPRRDLGVPVLAVTLMGLPHGASGMDVRVRGPPPLS